MTVYVVITADSPPPENVLGVFDSEEKAITCLMEKTDGKSPDEIDGMVVIVQWDVE